MQRSFPLCLAAVFLCVSPPSSFSQIEISGEALCAKPSPDYSIEVGDRPGHVFRILKGTCTYPKPFVLDGISAVSEEYTVFAELEGDRAKARSEGFILMSNGDKVFLHSESVGEFRKGQVQEAEVTWSWTSATGKLAKYTASGTTRIKGNPDGSRVNVFQGQVRLRK